MDSILLCAACRTRLREPVTLSCGNTICRACLPPHSDLATTFACPARQCHRPAHLFAWCQEIHMDVTIQRVLDAMPAIHNLQQILRCPLCDDILCDPITTQCGHSYCYGCLLMLKCQGEPCSQCRLPVPHYRHIRRHASTNQLIEQILASQHLHQRNLSGREPQYRSTLFVSDTVVLPRQRMWFSVFKSTDRHALRRAVFYSRRSLYLAVIYRGQYSTAIPRYGMLVQVVSVEERSPSFVSGTGLLLDVVGCERIRILASEQQEGDHGVETTVASYRLAVAVDGADNIGGAVQSAAHEIELRIRQLALVQEMTTPQQAQVLTTSVAGLLGPKWLNDVQRVQGPLPSSAQPDRLVWWVAAVLPIGVEQRQHLLCTEPLQRRLHLVLSWITQLSARWQRCRQTALRSQANGIGLPDE